MRTVKGRAWTGILICAGLLLATAAVHQVMRRLPRLRQGVLARVGSRTITVSEFETTFYQMAPDAQRTYATPLMRRELLFNLISGLLRPRLAEKIGYGKDRELMSRLKALTKRRYYIYEHDQVLDKWLTERLFNGELAVTERAIQRYYDFHTARYDKALLIDTSQIYLATRDEATRALALLAKGTSFEQVARSLSKDPATVASGGRMPPQLVVAGKPTREQTMLLLMKEGQIRGPVEHERGYLIVKRGSVRPASLENVRETIMVAIRTDRMKDWITHHWNDVPVYVNEKFLDALELKPS